MREGWKENAHHDPPTPDHEGVCDRNGCIEEEKDCDAYGHGDAEEYDGVERAGKQDWEIKRKEEQYQPKGKRNLWLEKRQQQQMGYQRESDHEKYLNHDDQRQMEQQ